MRILLCDDSMTVRKKHRELIRSTVECDIMEAKDGEAAVEAYKAHKPDFVLMDIMMPVKDGLSALTDIIEYDGNAKVIMLSSVGTKENLTLALKAGALDFLQKPIDIERLKSLIAQYSEED